MQNLKSTSISSVLFLSLLRVHALTVTCLKFVFARARVCAYVCSQKFIYDFIFFELGLHSHKNGYLYADVIAKWSYTTEKQSKRDVLMSCGIVVYWRRNCVCVCFCAYPSVCLAVCLPVWCMLSLLGCLNMLASQQQWDTVDSVSQSVSQPFRRFSIEIHVIYPAEGETDRKMIEIDNEKDEYVNRTDDCCEIRNRIVSG